MLYYTTQRKPLVVLIAGGFNMCVEIPQYSALRRRTDYCKILRNIAEPQYPAISRNIPLYAVARIIAEYCGTSRNIAEPQYPFSGGSLGPALDPSPAASIFQILDLILGTWGSRASFVFFLAACRPGHLVAFLAMGGICPCRAPARRNVEPLLLPLPLLGLADGRRSNHVPVSRHAGRHHTGLKGRFREDLRYV